MIFLTVKELLNDRGAGLKLRLLNNVKRFDRKILETGINRPTLELTGDFSNFPYKRIQILGNRELIYINKLKRSQQLERLKRLFSYRVPCVIITGKRKIPKALLRLSKQKNIPVIVTQYNTNNFISHISIYLNDKFAPKDTINGVLVDVYGMGVLILGKSGIGKSECALELIKRGHRLIGDDVVDVRKRSDKDIIGIAREPIKYFMEVRGIGIIDVKSLFGIEAVRDYIRIDLVVRLEQWEKEKYYDRLGMERKSEKILGVNLPNVVIPVRPGRNVATLIEVASMNQRLKDRGYISARELDKQLIEYMKHKT